MSAEDRATCRQLVAEAQAAGARLKQTCELLGVSVRTFERWQTKPEDGRKGPLTKPSHTLTAKERQKILDVANSAEFADLTPWQIVPRLADRGEYIASESTFYRVLKTEKLLAHRSKSQPRRHVKPQELMALSPNQIWSWDITYLKTTVRGKFYYLYLPMDIFSRMIVHWEVHEFESAELAANMIEVACENQGIDRNQITLHSDNGSPMKGATMLATLQRLGVAPSFSRPSVSDDNPFSEALFKTLKYCPSYPDDGFASIKEVKVWVTKFVDWYNNVHLHSGINWVTPASRHQNIDIAVLNKRHFVYQQAKAKNPNRWSRDTRDWSRPSLVQLNFGRRLKETKINTNSQ